MTDWSKCPAVESVPGKAEWQPGCSRELRVAGVRPIREPWQSGATI